MLLLVEYVGGYKVWECSIDVVKYLAAKVGRAGLEGKKVIELGCGQGLPGIVSYLLGAEVHFQDYDRQVIEHLTVPIVQENVQQFSRNGGVKQAPRYFYGDWGTLPLLLMSLGLDGMYDLVLTTETIYNSDSIPRLIQCIKKVCCSNLGSLCFGINC